MSFAWLSKHRVGFLQQENMPIGSHNNVIMHTEFHKYIFSNSIALCTAYYSFPYVKVMNNNKFEVNSPAVSVKILNTLHNSNQTLKGTLYPCFIGVYGGAGKQNISQNSTLMGLGYILSKWMKIIL